MAIAMAAMTMSTVTSFIFWASRAVTALLALQLQPRPPWPRRAHVGVFAIAFSRLDVIYRRA
jgi:hypothetical protein